MKNNLLCSSILALRLSVSGLETYIKMTALENYNNDKEKEKIQEWFDDIKQELSDLIASQS